jgi:fumarylacetoacetate (FAA) hydrolase family protein
MSTLEERLKKNPPDVERFNIDLPRQMKADLKAYAKARGVTVARVIRTLIELSIYQQRAEAQNPDQQ